jgi:hypothetical protein
MRWLRQQRKVEFLSMEAQTNSRRMNLARQQLVQLIHRSAQRPDWLPWAFAAGCLFGGVIREQKTATADQNNRLSVNILQYLNIMAVALKLLSIKTGEQPLE